MHKRRKNLLATLGVTVVYQFGSSVTGLKHKNSDVDLGILLEKNLSQKHYTELSTDLYKLFSEIFSNEEIDIVFLDEAPLSLQFDTIKYGKIIYEKNSSIRLQYEEKIILEYADFLPLQEEIDKAILERI